MSYASYDARFAALSQREKVLIFATGLIVIISVMVFLLIDPALTKNTKTSDALLPLESEILSLQQQSVIYEQALAEDPNTKLREQIASVNERMTVLQNQFSAQLSDLILPRQMPVLIEQVFSQAEGLTLIEMASIKPVNIFADNEAMAEVPLPDAIDDDAGRQRIVHAYQPARERQTPTTRVGARLEKLRLP